jgi:hypothetical protein
MPCPSVNRGRLAAWVLVGIALDAAALAGIWIEIDTIGPLAPLMERWLDLVGLVAVPWYVHVVALPLIFRMVPSTWIEKGLLLARAAAFTVIAGLCIPIVGIIAVWFVGMPWLVILAIVSERRGAASWGLIGSITSLIASAAIAGTVIGSLLHASRTGRLYERVYAHVPLRSREPRFRSDALGGAIAAFMGVGGMLVAVWLGLFSRPVDSPGDGMHSLAAAPQFPTAVLIGTLALLPHLVMTGIDTLAADPPREQQASTAQNV